MSTMKPGTDTGSGINHIYSRMTKGAPEPEVGMGATLLSWTDRKAATVIEVDGKIVKVQHDTAIRTDDLGMTDCQSYRYERNPGGCIETFRRDGQGGYDPVHWNDQTKRWNKVGRGGLIVGKRDHYHDFSF
ncbi:hypothetical protein [Roseovarius sp. MMSF_3281]|uniref:hypothetical protein n=1 Tax=Roseovarius sp. MMSF_3281 TaxID=3046694 RepID=UPI00273FFD36|nr:hypothetical protein [Roseovarius sp. MMSF_3281]